MARDKFTNFNFFLYTGWTIIVKLIQIYFLYLDDMINLLIPKSVKKGQIF